MCGLAGLFVLSGDVAAMIPGVEQIVRRMTATLVSRGPDAAGFSLVSPVAFGHRRLSILELSDAGAQPMQLGDSGPVITYNGEIYNFRELRRELEVLGCQFRGHSDTEVILYAYARWGMEGLKRLEGIFALALWDPAKKRLVLMRDRFGVKPLYYGKTDQALVFGSEIKAVLAAGCIDQTLDDQSLSEYLWYGNSHGERTFFKGVRSLEPGQWFVVEDGHHRIEPWWRVEEWLGETGQPATFDDAADRVRDALDVAVDRQLVADVPVGLFLSGGVDSSSIAASAMRCRTEPLRSFSAGFDFDRGINELPLAKKVAGQLGLDHNELHISGGKLQDVLLALARAHDEPFADAANIPLYLMCQALKGETKVVLQGDGGDELFAGYRRYALLRNEKYWRLWPKMLSPLAGMAGSYGRRFVRLAETVGNPDTALRMAFLLTTESLRNAPEQLFSTDRREALQKTTDPFLAYREAAERFAGHEPVQQMLLTDLTVQLPSQFLPKVDRATMAAGIEARVPLLDEQVARLAVNLPSIWKAQGTEKKIVLRRSQEGRVPDAVLHGPKKGFSVPYKFWLRGALHDFTRERLLDSVFINRFELDGARLEQLLLQDKTGTLDAGFLLWKMLQLALFTEVQENQPTN